MNDRSASSDKRSSCPTHSSVELRGHEECEGTGNGRKRKERKKMSLFGCFNILSSEFVTVHECVDITH